MLCLTYAIDFWAHTHTHTHGGAFFLSQTLPLYFHCISHVVCLSKVAITVNFARVIPFVGVGSWEDDKKCLRRIVQCSASSSNKNLIGLDFHLDSNKKQMFLWNLVRCLMLRIVRRFFLHLVRLPHYVIEWRMLSDISFIFLLISVFYLFLLIELNTIPSFCIHTGKKIDDFLHLFKGSSHEFSKKFS